MSGKQTPMTKEDSQRIQASQAKSGGDMSNKGFASRAQAAGDRHANAGGGAKAARAVARAARVAKAERSKFEDCDKSKQEQDADEHVTTWTFSMNLDFRLITLNG